MDLVKKWKDLKDLTRSVLRQTKKNKGDLYLVQFKKNQWEKCPEIHDRIRVTRDCIEGQNILNKKGWIVRFKINDIGNLEKYWFTYIVYLPELNKEFELKSNEFEVLKEQK